MIDQASNQPLPTKDELRAEILFYRALEKRKAGDLEGAIADYTEAIRLDPTFASAYNNRGATWSKIGIYDEAISNFDTLIRLEPDNSDAYFNRGFNRAAKGDMTGAIADYSQTLRINPGDVDAMINRAEAHYELKQYAKAFADFVQLNDRTGGSAASLAKWVWHSQNMHWKIEKRGGSCGRVWWKKTDGIKMSSGCAKH